MALIKEDLMIKFILLKALFMMK